MDKASLLLAVVWLLSQKTQVSTSTMQQLAIIVPMDNSRLFSKQRISPAIDYALETVRNEDIYSDKVTVRYADSKCNSIAAPIAAFDFFRHDQASVFLGPVCDYSLAPVARYAPFWSIPVITPGGMAHDFGADKSSPDSEFPMLTRVGWSFDSLAVYISTLVSTYEWLNVKLLYDAFGHDQVADRFCFLAMSALIRLFRMNRQDFHLYMFDDTKGQEEYSNMLLEEVNTKYASKSHQLALVTHWSIISLVVYF